MAPLITLYILGACVAVAAGLFVVMLVLTALRPPRLPDLPIGPAPPTLQRVIRALTPPPVAVAQPAIVHRDVITSAIFPPRTAQPPIARPAIAKASVATARPLAAKSSVTLPPHVGTVGRRFIPLGPAAAAPASRTTVYPVKRSRALPRVLLAVLATTVLAASLAVASPHLLDPLCDDYEWFGADVATTIREHAREARATIADWLARL